MAAFKSTSAVGEVPAEIWSRICWFLHAEEYGPHGFYHGEPRFHKDSFYSQELIRALLRKNPEACVLLETGPPRRDPFPNYSSIISQFQRFYPDATPNPKQDLYSFRLVCKLFSVIAARFTHQHICVLLTRSHLQKLDHVANHPSISTAVQTLRYYATDFAQWEKVSEESYNYGHDRLPNPQGLMARVVDLSLKPANYAQYSAIYEEQSERKRGNEDQKYFTNVFPRFQHLQAIDILCGTRLLRRHRVRGREYDHLDLRENSLGVRAFETVLPALADAGITLKSLEAGLFHWRFFERDCKCLIACSFPCVSYNALSWP